jgi:hypothetical protein
MYGWVWRSALHARRRSCSRALRIHICVDTCVHVCQCIATDLGLWSTLLPCVGYPVVCTQGLKAYLGSRQLPQTALHMHVVLCIQHSSIVTPPYRRCAWLKQLLRQLHADNAAWKLTQMPAWCTLKAQSRPQQQRIPALPAHIHPPQHTEAHVALALRQLAE